ncbi:MAG: dihydroxyacetone kinase subunit L [Mycoplasmataceae bacterium]|jgi:dihydroxyacetone kinase-like protein|nr:dihydroxyacetone kinase subunit L [Mycoplasmataceae bacterium]
MEITKYIQSITNELINNESKLNALDTAIGDGDHGSNVVRGFKAILEQSSQFTKESLIEKDLMTCAQQLMSKIGGSSGPLLGSAFMALAISFKSKTTFTNKDLALGIQAAFDRISQLGKSKLGEKTMLDAIHPTIDAFNNSNSNSLDFAQAATAANKGAEATIPMLAMKGRASYLGERSIGHMDPGAYSVALIFKALSETQDIPPTQTTNSDKLEPNENISNEMKLQPISKNVSILVVSHSQTLAQALVEFAKEMKTGDFAFEYVAGIENGKVFGTDSQIIKNKLETLVVNSEVLIIYDLGSSKMNSELAISLFPSDAQKRIKLASCAFVEGTIVAVSSNNTNSVEELKNIVESQMKVEK